MKKRKILRILAVLILIGIMGYGGFILKEQRAYLINNAQGLRKIKTVVFENKKSINVELALTGEEQIKGLSGRKSLPEDEGMLFVWPNDGLRKMWMKKMNFSLDMIFISGQKKIVDIYKNLQPCTDENNCESVGTKARYVLEAGGGWAGRNGVKVGEKVRMEESGRVVEW